MKRHQKLHLHIGLRMFKTALAVTIALAIARLFQSYSPIFAGLGAVVAMARTLRESLDAAKTQFVGVILGGIVSMLLLVIDPTPSVLLIGGGVLVALALCGIFKLYYAVSLTAIIVLSVCVNTGGDPPLVALGFRLIDTSIGLSVALAVNMLIKPYNNRHRVTNLLHKLADAVPACLEQRFVYDLTPDLTPMVTDLRALDVELDIFRRQHFRRREAHDRDLCFLRGLFQLADRMEQELSALCTLDLPGIPDEDNCRRLEELGLTLPDFTGRKSTEEIDFVCNYHLKIALQAREYLLELLELPPEPH